MADRDPKVDPRVGDFALAPNGARIRLEEIRPPSRRYGAGTDYRVRYTTGVTRWVSLDAWQRFPGHENGAGGKREP